MEPYRVPFLFDRSRAPDFRLMNIGGERLRGVSVALTGSGMMSPVIPGSLDPEEAIELRIRGGRLALESTLIVRWVRPNGEDYLWRVSF